MPQIGQTSRSIAYFTQVSWSVCPLTHRRRAVLPTNGRSHRLQRPGYVAKAARPAKTRATAPPTLNSTPGIYQMLLGGTTRQTAMPLSAMWTIGAPDGCVPDVHVFVTNTPLTARPRVVPSDSPDSVSGARAERTGEVVCGTLSLDSLIKGRECSFAMNERRRARTSTSGSR